MAGIFKWFAKRNVQSPLKTVGVISEMVSVLRDLSSKLWSLPQLGSAGIK